MFRESKDLLTLSDVNGFNGSFKEMTWWIFDFTPIFKMLLACMDGWIVQTRWYTEYRFVGIELVRFFWNVD